MSKIINNVTYLSPPEVAEKLDLAESTVRNYIRRGMISSIKDKFTRRVLVSVLEVEKFEQTRYDGLEENELEECINDEKNTAES